jgi:RimJ/RimL family protein N-acetyltransferase
MGAPFVLTNGGFVMSWTDEGPMEQATMVTDVEAQARTTGDGRRWTLRPARPTDARGLAALFDDVRREGRWLLTSPSAVSQPSEAFFIGEMLRTGEGLALVAEADGDPIGTVQISLERNVVTNHVGTLSIVVAEGWRDVGVGSALIETALRWARDHGLLKVALAVFPDNERAIAVYQRAGFVREGLRRKQYRADGGVLRDELLMAWFPDTAGGEP